MQFDWQTSPWCSAVESKLHATYKYGDATRAALNIDSFQFLSSGYYETSEGYQLNVLFGLPETEELVKPKIEFYANKQGPQENPSDACPSSGIDKVNKLGPTINQALLKASGAPNVTLNVTTGLRIVQADLGATTGNTTLNIMFTDDIDTNTDIYRYSVDGSATVQFCIHEYLEVKLPDGISTVIVDQIDVPFNLQVNLASVVVSANSTVEFEVDSSSQAPNQVPSSANVLTLSRFLFGSLIAMSTLVAL